MVTSSKKSSLVYTAGTRALLLYSCRTLWKFISEPLPLWIVRITLHVCLPAPAWNLSEGMDNVSSMSLSSESSTGLGRHSVNGKWTNRVLAPTETNSNTECSTQERIYFGISCSQNSRILKMVLVCPKLSSWQRVQFLPFQGISGLPRSCLSSLLQGTACLLGTIFNWASSSKFI